MSMLAELSEDKAEMEMTPMIDVTFLLLIFFMCTLKFKTLEGKLAAYLPKDVGVNQMDAEPIEKVEILMRVVKEGTKLKLVGKGGSRPYTSSDTGRFDWGEDRVMEYNVGPYRTSDLDKLGDKLVKVYRDRLNSGEEKVPATIDARPKTVYADVVKVLDQAIDAGFMDITFVGAYPDHIE
jgi:biopolymer transport protein ExbD